MEKILAAFPDVRTFPEGHYDYIPLVIAVRGDWIATASIEMISTDLRGGEFEIRV